MEVTSTPIVYRIVQAAGRLSLRCRAAGRLRPLARNSVCAILVLWRRVEKLRRIRLPRSPVARGERSACARSGTF